MLERLMRDHVAMREKGEALSRLLDLDAMPDSMVLADARWQLSSFIMQHLAFEDRQLYSKLAVDDRPAVADIARQFQTDLEQIFARFSAHAQHWTPQRIARDWHGFRHQAKAFVGGMYARIDQEEAELFPLVGDAAIDLSTSAVPTHNWTREAFTIKDAITSGLTIDRAVSA